MRRLWYASREHADHSSVTQPEPGRAPAAANKLLQRQINGRFHLARKRPFVSDGLVKTTRNRAMTYEPSAERRPTKDLFLDRNPPSNPQDSCE